MTESSPSPPPGKVAVLGAGPAGMAAALPCPGRARRRPSRAYREARPAGNILNLWPPPLKALRPLGVDTDDLGSPRTEFRNARRARSASDVDLDEDVRRATAAASSGCSVRSCTSGCWPHAARRDPGSTAAVERIEQDETGVHAALRRRQHRRARRADRRRRHRLPGPPDAVGRRPQARAPAAHLRRLHLRRGRRHRARTSRRHPHRTVQGSWTSIRHNGRDGHPVVGAHRDRPGPPLHRRPAGGRDRAGGTGFPAPLPGPDRRDRRRERAALGAARPAGR